MLCYYYNNDALQAAEHAAVLQSQSTEHETLAQSLTDQIKALGNLLLGYYYLIIHHINEILKNTHLSYNVEIHYYIYNIMLVHLY